MIIRSRSAICIILVIASFGLSGCYSRRPFLDFGSQSCDCGSGVHSGQCCNDLLGMIPAPPGTYLCQWQSLHAARAGEDDFMIYEAAWVDGTDELGPFAQKRLSSMARDSYYVDTPIIIEPTDDTDLNARRQSAVADLMFQNGFEVPSELIVIGHSEALGLYGEEANGLAKSIFQSSPGQLKQVAPTLGGARGGLSGGFAPF